jgi:hypothetical protein
MAKLADDTQVDFVKGLIYGDGGAGKTSSLISLIEAGYTLRIYDFDNLLKPLKELIKARCPERIDQVSVQTFTDKLKGIDVPVVMQGASMKVMPNVVGTPKAYSDAMKQLNHWKDGTRTWAPPSILGRGHHRRDRLPDLRRQQRVPLRPGDEPDGEGTADLLLRCAEPDHEPDLPSMQSEDFGVHVLVLAHLNYEKDKEGVLKGFPKSIGSALNTSIATNFNTALLVESVGNQRQARDRHTVDWFDRPQEPCSFLRRTAGSAAIRNWLGGVLLRLQIVT